MSNSFDYSGTQTTASHTLVFVMAEDDFEIVCIVGTLEQCAELQALQPEGYGPGRYEVRS